MGKERQNNMVSNAVVEGKKQQIILEIENIKFAQSFLIPTASGLTTLLFTYEKIGLTLATIIGILGGCILLLSSFFRKKAAVRIKKLIQNF